jgi:hypothetical protein
MKNILSLLALAFLVTNIQGQKPEDTEDWSRKPKVVITGENNKPPSDAFVLYGGKQDLINWVQERGGPVQWNADTILTVVGRTGTIITVKSFGDVQLHLEWRSPAKISGDGQNRGNSGIYFMMEYELQILDSWKNETYSNGFAGSIYKQFGPLVNASLQPGKWQTYDVIFTAPRFNVDKTLKSPACITLLHNGILVQNHTELKGQTEYIGKPAYKFHEDKLPLMLQDHNSPVSYRNIWIREL